MLFLLFCCLVFSETERGQREQPSNQEDISFHQSKICFQVLRRVADKQSLQPILHFILMKNDFSCLLVALKFRFNCQIKMPNKNKNNNCMKWQGLGMREDIQAFFWRQQKFPSLNCATQKKNQNQNTKLLAVQQLRHSPGSGKHSKGANRSPLKGIKQQS